MRAGFLPEAVLFPVCTGEWTFIGTVQKNQCEHELEENNRDILNGNIMALDTIPLQAFERTAKFVATPKQSALCEVKTGLQWKIREAHMLDLSAICNLLCVARL